MSVEFQAETPLTEKVVSDNKFSASLLGQPQDHCLLVQGHCLQQRSSGINVAEVFRSQHAFVDIGLADISHSWRVCFGMDFVHDMCSSTRVCWFGKHLTFIARVLSYGFSRDVMLATFA